MNTRACRLASIGLLLLAGAGPAGPDEPPRPPAGAEVLQAADGGRLPGRLVGDASSGYRFAVDSGAAPVALSAGAVVEFSGAGPGPTAGSPPFRVELGLGRRISGRLVRVDDQSVRLEATSVGGEVVAARAGARAVVQRVGEVQVLDEGFESLSAARWALIGDPEIAEGPRVAGGHSLLVPAGGSSVTCRLAEPLASGRLELAFHDSGVVAAGQQCFADLLFRGPAGEGTVRAVLGWAEESLSVESPRGPALAVQRLARKAGWHRLSIRFGPEQTEVAVDGNDLAHGKGTHGPLVEVRLASHRADKVEPPPGLAVHFDDLRLVRFAEPASGLEVDPTQDEVRLTGGDQLFGTLLDADGERVRLKVDARDVALPWSEVSGIEFRRAAGLSRPVDGLLVRLQWRTSPGEDPRDLDQLDGALAGLSETALTLDVPYVGTVRIPRDRARRLEVLGQARRTVIDATAHHLGNDIVRELDPPQPEGGVLERSFDLDAVPPGPATLSLDVLLVVGEASGLPFQDMIQKGEIRTNVRINDRAIDYLNRHITSTNETPERVRVPIPAGVLRAGLNRLRLEQVGRAGDPNYLDDLGVLEIAVEFPAGRPPAPAPERP